MKLLNECVNEFEIIIFCLIFALAGVLFRGDLNYFGHMA